MEGGSRLSFGPAGGHILGLLPLGRLLVLLLLLTFRRALGNVMVLHRMSCRCCRQLTHSHWSSAKAHSFAHAVGLSIRSSNGSSSPLCSILLPPLCGSALHVCLLPHGHWPRFVGDCTLLRRSHFLPLFDLFLLLLLAELVPFSDALDRGPCILTATPIFGRSHLTGLLVRRNVLVDGAHGLEVAVLDYLLIGELGSLLPPLLRP
mmetsp:Transcript_1095/g.2544  ORF Transcript_1095/g.2544 Transcript_1095/m.2544 type:complete len:205 (-) Transcript_1095:381-995(-)